MCIDIDDLGDLMFISANDEYFKYNFSQYKQI